MNQRLPFCESGSGSEYRFETRFAASSSSRFHAFALPLERGPQAVGCGRGLHPHTQAIHRVRTASGSAQACHAWQECVAFWASAAPELLPSTWQLSFTTLLRMNRNLPSECTLCTCLRTVKSVLAKASLKAAAASRVGRPAGSGKAKQCGVSVSRILILGGGIRYSRRNFVLWESGARAAREGPGWMHKTCNGGPARSVALSFGQSRARVEELAGLAGLRSVRSARGGGHG